MQTDNLVKTITDFDNAIFQRRKDFCAVFGFETPKEAIEKLGSMSYQEDRTFVYYNTELYSVEEFKAIYENYGGIYDENNGEDQQDTCGCCCNGVCSL